jgi:hypothetical protein
MKKLFFLVSALSLTLSSCLPAALQPQATAAPAQNLEATAAIYSQQTLQALPTPTLVPSITPVITTPTETPTQATSTETQNPILLTLTATLGTGTAAVGSETTLLGTPGAPTVTITTNPALSTTPAETSYPQYSGTMPPSLPFGEIRLINKSKAEVYISLRCVTKDNYVTIIEYPVKSIVTTRAPAGQYTYVVWVGGRKIVGNFSLAKSEDLTINIYKDRVGIK